MSNQQAESGFIEPNNTSSENDAEWLMPLPSAGTTSQCYKLVKGGEVMFVKALRENYQGEEQFRQLFRKEYEVGRVINSPYIVRYHSFEEDAQGGCRLLMEYVEGDTLAERLKSDATYFAKEPNVRKLLIQLLEALRCLHSRGIVHLDLKPDNIMLTRVNNDLKLLDLGYCYSDSYPFTPGRNPLFAAPEQLSAGNMLDARTDIYAIGKLLNYIFEQASVPAQGWTKPYRQIIARCVNPEPSKRYPDVSEIAALMAETKRNRWLLLSAFTALVLLFVWMGCHYHWGRMLHRQIYGYDFAYVNLHFNVISDDDMSCEVVGLRCPADSLPNNDLCIFSPARSGRTEYRVIAIGDSAFFGNQGILRISLPSTIRRIGTNAFADCTNLRLVSLPDSMAEMANDAFARCDSLQSIFIPKGLTRIPHALFHRCSMTSVVVPEGVEVIEQDAFVSCAKLRSIQLPSTITSIQRGSFYACTSLEQITLPASLTSIGEYCFMECPNLHQIYNKAPLPQRATALFDAQASLTVYVPQGSIDAYRADSLWSKFNLVPMD